MKKTTADIKSLEPEIIDNISTKKKGGKNKIILLLMLSNFLSEIKSKTKNKKTDNVITLIPNSSR
ncbi:hypothetical protein GCM10007082_24520 [Oceanisphaera arctica]|nr:hypothetical protein GCM10007082_24520 [Oceanisphaera arctica]